jgi:type IV pilus assembly protein PilO
MDFKDSKTQKIALGVLAFLVVGYFWYTRLYSQYDNQILSKSAEFETITTDLRNVELKAKSLDALKIEYEELLTRYHDIEALLPEFKQIPSFLVQLHTASSITGTKVTKLNPLPITTEDFYNVASFEVELTGTYHDFGGFISYVANFPFITNVSQMNVKANTVSVGKKLKGDAAEGQLQELKKKETITANFVLSTYFVKEEERLKELSL